MRVYQWVLKNNQETGFDMYLLTDTFHPSGNKGKKEVEELYCTEHLFSAIMPFKLSVEVGYTAESLYSHSLEKLRLHRECPHGHEDWDDCPVCGH